MEKESSMFCFFLLNFSTVNLSSHVCVVQINQRHKLITCITEITSSRPKYKDFIREIYM